jgi:membrane-associated phospholipid phosphatase
MSSFLLAWFVLISISLPLPAYWQEKGKTELRNAALTIPWAIFFIFVLFSTVGAVGRLSMGHALQDDYFAHLDRSLGVSVPYLTAWASDHWLGGIINATYLILFPMLLVAFLAPALTGKVKTSQAFILSNLAAFAIGLPLFALYPAIGPWYGYHFPMNHFQELCQQSILLLHTPGPYNLQPIGVICFPSFHVIWAIIAADSLCCFKPLRFPAILLSMLIILSTMTTGWHYFVDVLSGIVVSALALLVSRVLSNWCCTSQTIVSVPRHMATT